MPIPVIGISSSLDSVWIRFSELKAIDLAICPEDESVTSESPYPVWVLESATVLKVNCVTSKNPTSAFAFNSGKVKDQIYCFLPAASATEAKVFAKVVALVIVLVQGLYLKVLSAEVSLLKTMYWLQEYTIASESANTPPVEALLEPVVVVVVV